MKYVHEGKGKFRIEYSAEEQAAIDRHRRNLRLSLARKNVAMALEVYSSLRALEGERRREDEVLN